MNKRNIQFALLPTSLLALSVMMTLTGGIANAAQTQSVPAATSATPAPKANQTPNQAGSDQRAKFSACLAKQGIKLPSQAPGTGGFNRPSGAPGAGGVMSARPRPTGSRAPFTPTGVDPQKFQKAIQACGGSGFAGGLSGAGRGGQNSTAFQAFSSCLKDHGVKSSPTTGVTGLNQKDPKVAAALKTCAPLMPKFGGQRPTPLASK